MTASFMRFRAKRSIVCVECGAVFEVLANGASRKRWCDSCRLARHKVALAAMNAMNMAIRRGQLKCAEGQACRDCGAPATALDHRDYTKPLDVVPVCDSCNYRRGPALWKAA